MTIILTAIIMYIFWKAEESGEVAKFKAEQILKAMIKGKIFELLAATAMLSGSNTALENKPAPVLGKRLPGKEWNKKKKRRRMQGDSRKANR